jgi:SPP1 gp7 family putative phage head morphogenesis protein
MKIWRFGKNTEIKKLRQEVETLKSEIKSGFMPIQGGVRVSEDATTQFHSKLGAIPPDFAIEWFDTLVNLAAYNEDVSYALDNLVQLSNTKHEIIYSDSVSESIRKNLNELITDNQNSWYNNSEGIRSLKSDLLAQAVIFGAISAEIVPTLKLDNIHQVFRVSPRNIVFVYDPESIQYLTYQRSYSGKGTAGLIALNPVTYHYAAWRRLHESPYPTPPFLSACRDVLIKSSMKDNFAEVMKRIGMLGILSVSVSPPEQEQGETNTDYIKRSKEYLDKYIYPQIKNALSTGVIAGYKDAQEVKLETGKMDAKSSETLMKIIDLMVFSGLKQDPNMLGRNFSTTETFGKVVLAKMTNQIRDYQALVDSFFLKLYKLFAQLNGFDPEFIKGVESEVPMISDEVAAADAEGKRIANAESLYTMGVIDQQTKAQKLGYEKPALPESKQPAVPASTKTKDQAKNSAIRMIEGYESYLNKKTPVFRYNDGHNHNESIRMDFGSAKIDRMANKYYADVEKAFVQSNKKAATDAANVLFKSDASENIETVKAKVYAKILETYSNGFNVDIVPLIKRNVTEIFDYSRKDTTIFPEDKGFSKGSFFKAPEAKFDLLDYRAIDYYNSLDKFYLGKFITDDDTKNRVYKYITEKYIKGQTPIGKNRKDLDSFRKEFEKVLNMESWKISRIIDTTVQTIRNDGNVMYMNQAEIEKYEIVEMGDNLTCQYCLSMDGKVFEVKTAIEKIKTKVDSDPANLNITSPFLTSYPLDQIKTKTNSELQAMGFTTSPYHPKCRGRVVASIE